MYGINITCKMISETDTFPAAAIKCAHCGEDCTDHPAMADGKQFCCNGCRSVYQLINSQDLCDYYSLNQAPGNTPLPESAIGKYDFLDDENLSRTLFQYLGTDTAYITLAIPGLHCSSCIQLLENLGRFNEGILASSADFASRKLNVRFNPAKITLRELVVLLAKLGYEPHISLADSAGISAPNKLYENGLVKRIGLTGFCLGNLMILGFAVYLGLDPGENWALTQTFRWASLILSLPVVFYGASPFIIPAWKAISNRTLNIDVPLAIGIITLFLRSVYETVLLGTSGYADSLAGLVFLLLLGRYISGKTWGFLNFNNNYQTFFPLSARVIVSQQAKERLIFRPLNALVKGDLVELTNADLIPADGYIVSQSATIDYSFVTGESVPVVKYRNEEVFAGGRISGPLVRMIVSKPVSESYLISVWNQQSEAKLERNGPKNENTVGNSNLARLFTRYFTLITLSVAFLSAIYWCYFNPSVAINAFTAVLIVACPCALSLAMPFTMGQAMTALAAKGFFVKNPGVVEQLAQVTDIVFDKTGTLNDVKKWDISFTGTEWNEETRVMVRSAAMQSSHPLAQALANWLKPSGFARIDNVSEIAGQGIAAQMGNHKILIGNVQFIDLSWDEAKKAHSNGGSQVHIRVDGDYMGCFMFRQRAAKGIIPALEKLAQHYNLALLSGDKITGGQWLTSNFTGFSEARFGQSPLEKKVYIESLQKKGSVVLMAGDGLNDAAALSVANIGLALCQSSQSFTPASDIIANPSALVFLDGAIAYSKSCIKAVKTGFWLSVIYNLLGLGIAVSGQLSPLWAAVFMPLSSLSVTGLATGLGWYHGKILNGIKP